MRKKTAILLLLLNAVISAFGYLLITVASNAGLSASAIVLGRGAVATLTCVLLFGKHCFRIDRKGLLTCIFVGVINFFGFILSTKSSELSTPSNVSLILSSSIVLVPFLDWLINKRRPSGKVFFCAALCLGGMGVLTGAFGAGFQLDLGVVFALLATFSFALYTVLTGRYAKDIDYRPMVFCSALCLAVGGALFFLLEGPAAYAAPIAWPTAILAILGLGIFASLVYFIIQVVAFAHVSVTTGSLLLCTDALFTSVLSILVGFDTFSYRLLAGGVMITLAVMLQELNFTKKRQ